MPEQNGQEYARTELRRRIDESGLGITRYARERLIRDPSTGHRWIHEDEGKRSPIPSVVISWLLGAFRYTGDSTRDE